MLRRIDREAAHGEADVGLRCFLDAYNAFRNGDDLNGSELHDVQRQYPILFDNCFPIVRNGDVGCYHKGEIFEWSDPVEWQQNIRDNSGETLPAFEPSL